MPRTTHHPERTRSAGSHRERPHRGRCAECAGPMPRNAHGRSCPACLMAPEAAGWPMLDARTAASVDAER